MTTNPQETLKRLGLDARFKFVPFSRSRNAKEERLTLNWRVTVTCNGREVLFTDYSAGVAHCPGYRRKLTAPSDYSGVRFKRHDGKPYPDGRLTRLSTPAERLEKFRDSLCAAECEQGVALQWDRFGRRFAPVRVVNRGVITGAESRTATVPILPEVADVFYSLSMDSTALDYGDFESWADDFGYSSDSISGKSIYDACLGIALNMRAAIGDSGLAELREAFQDY